MNNHGAAMEPFVKYRKSGAIATITLNRPEKYNTIRQEMALGIEEYLRDARSDALDSFYGHSVLREDPVERKPQVPPNGVKRP